MIVDSESSVYLLNSDFGDTNSNVTVIAKFDYDLNLDWNVAISLFALNMVIDDSESYLYFATQVNYCTFTKIGTSSGNLISSYALSSDLDFCSSLEYGNGRLYTLAGGNDKNYLVEFNPSTNSLSRALELNMNMVELQTFAYSNTDYKRGLFHPFYHAGTSTTIIISNLDFSKSNPLLWTKQWD